MPALALTAFAMAWLAIGLSLFGARRPACSHWRHTISEIGESGAPDRRLVAFALFLPVGVVLLLAAATLHAASPAAATLALAIAAATSGRPRFRAIPGFVVLGAAIALTMLPASACAA
jgi:hypothetical protein